jgi:hypothetical protein
MFAVFVSLIDYSSNSFVIRSLRTVSLHWTMAPDKKWQGRRAGRILANSWGQSQTRWHVRMHPLRVLQHRLPFLLVECWQILGPGCTNASVQVDWRFSWWF